MERSTRLRESVQDDKCVIRVAGVDLRVEEDRPHLLDVGESLPAERGFLCLYVQNLPAEPGVQPDLERREKPTLEDEGKFLDLRCVHEGAPDGGEPGGGSDW